MSKKVCGKYYETYEEYLAEGRERTSSSYWNWRKANTIEGYLQNKYSQIKTRCLGTHKVNAKRYAGIDFCTLEEFNSWCDKEMETIIALWNAWIASGKEYKLALSVDRRDNNKGYTIDNMQWLTHGANSKKKNK